MKGKENDTLDVLGRVCPYPLVLTKKKMEKMLKTKEALEEYSMNENNTPQRRHSLALKLITLNKDIELLKPKLYD